MARILPVTEVKAKFTRLASGIAGGQEEVIVTRNGRPAVSVVNYERYESLKTTLEILSNRKSMAMFKKTGRYFARGGKGKTIEQVFGK